MPTQRTVEVSPDRVERWIAGFAERHGTFTAISDDEKLVLSAADGATAVLASAFEPVAWSGDPVEAFARHLTARRVVGLVLVRLGGYAAGIFDGVELVASKVGSRQVHGRSAAGGWSQQRFARRREGQARVALAAAADAAAAIVAPQAGRLDAVVTGGDRQALRAVLADPRLAALKPLVSRRVLDVPDPKAKVLRAAILAATAAHVTITEPAPPSASFAE